jgi:hypothetical protein
MILEWASGPAQRDGGFDAPIFLKFGGMDAEYAWMMRRIRRGTDAFSFDEFDDYARRSVERYGRFLALLSERLDPALLRVCTAFPTTLYDVHWRTHFVEMIGGSKQERSTLAAALAGTELPDFRTRTQMRVAYNTYLKQMCAAAGLRCIDDFAAAIGADGLVDHRYIAAHGGTDHHVDYTAMETPITTCLLDALTPRQMPV